MALINCPDCNTEVSDSAETCLKCGFALQSIKYAEKIQNAKNSDCFRSVAPLVPEVENARKFLSSNAMSILMIVSMMLIFAYGIGLLIFIPYLFIESKHKKNLKNGMKKILDCFKNVYPIVDKVEARLYFDVIESNVSFTTRSGEDKDTVKALAYIYANKIGADAIVFGDVSTDAIVSGHVESKSSAFSINPLSKDKVVGTTSTSLVHGNQCSFLKIKGNANSHKQTIQTKADIKQTPIVNNNIKVETKKVETSYKSTLPPLLTSKEIQKILLDIANKYNEEIKNVSIKSQESVEESTAKLQEELLADIQKSKMLVDEDIITQEDHDNKKSNLKNTMKEKLDSIKNDILVKEKDSIESLKLEQKEKEKEVRDNARQAESDKRAEDKKIAAIKKSQDEELRRREEMYSNDECFIEFATVEEKETQLKKLRAEIEEEYTFISKDIVRKNGSWDEFVITINFITYSLKKK